MGTLVWGAIVGSEYFCMEGLEIEPGLKMNLPGFDIEFLHNCRPSSSRKKNSRDGGASKVVFDTEG